MALYIAVRLEHRYDNGYIAFWALKQNVEWTGVSDIPQTITVIKRQKLQR